jgi:micrococcal nuclease
VNIANAQLNRKKWLSILFLFFMFSWGVCSAQEWVEVDYVPDGDTVILKDGRHVRYIGIDATEIDHDNHRAQPMGYEARSMNRDLIEGRRIKIVTDRETFDRYGRTLAYVYREDGLFVNAELLKRGYAFYLFLFPNTTQSKNCFQHKKRQCQQQEGSGRWSRKMKPPHIPIWETSAQNDSTSMIVPMEIK